MRMALPVFLFPPLGAPPESAWARHTARARGLILALAWARARKPPKPKNQSFLTLWQNQKTQKPKFSDTIAKPKNPKNKVFWHYGRTKKTKKHKFSDTMAERGLAGIISGNFVFLVCWFCHSVRKLGFFCFFGSAIVSENFVFFGGGFRFLGFWGFLALAHARARARIRLIRICF